MIELRRQGRSEAVVCHRNIPDAVGLDSRNLANRLRFQTVSVYGRKLAKVSELSLIGVVGVKLFLVPQAIPVGHSLLFAVGAWPPHDGVRRVRRLNLSRDLEALLSSSSGLPTRSPCPSSPRERRGSTLVRRKLELLSSCGRGLYCRLLAPAEFAAVDPHTVQDDRQLASHRDTGACQAPALGDVHAPRA